MSSLKPRWADIQVTPRQSDAGSMIDLVMRAADVTEKSPSLRKMKSAIPRANRMRAPRVTRYTRATWLFLSRVLATLAQMEPRVVVDHVSWFLREQFGMETCHRYLHSRAYCMPLDVVMLAAAVASLFPHGFVMWIRSEPGDLDGCAEVHFPPFADPRRYSPTRERMPVIFFWLPGYISASYWLRSGMWG